MAAGIADHFTEATNGTRPVPTTLTAIKNIGASSITCNALTGWPTATAVHFIIYTINSSGAKLAGTQTDWKGIVSSNTITNLTLKAGTDAGYGIGAVVECAPTAAWADDMADGLLVQHNQDGTHAAVTATSVAATGVINASTVSSLQDTGVALSTYRNENQLPFTASGGVWTGDAYASTRNASMTAWTGYINGQRGTIGAVTARTFAASSDTYIDVLNTSGVFTLVYTPVVNNAASPSLAANSMRIGIIVTAATNIAAAGSINQGSPTAVLPIASSIAYSVTDSLGNRIYPTNPNGGMIGYRQITANFSPPSAAIAQVTGLSAAVIVPAGRSVKVTIFTSFLSSTASTQLFYSIWRGTTGSGTNLNQTEISGIGAGVMATNPDNPGTGSFTYNAGIASNAITTTIGAGATAPAYIMVELI